jgi:hypothetical protein
MKPCSLLKASVSLVLLAAHAATPPAWASPTSSPQIITHETASALLAQALKHQKDGAFEEAIRAYGEALKGPISDKTRITAIYNRALAYHQAGQPGMAIHDFSAVLLLNPELSHAYYGRANALRETGQYASALADYQKAAYYRYPHGHLPRFGQALTYELLDRPLSAEKLLQETLHIKPDFEPARRKLGELQSAAPATVRNKDKAKLSVAVSVQSVYGSMTDRIDDIVTGSIKPVKADQIVRKPGLPKPVRPPSHLLDAAEQVEVATLQLPGAAASLSFLQTPASISPAFVVAEKTEIAKIEDRVPQEVEPLRAGAAVKIEPVSAPVELKSAVAEQTEIDTETPPSVLPKAEGYLVQINSQRSEAAAWAAWDKLQDKHGKLLRGREAIVQKADLGAKGIVYRLRIHALPSKDEASNLCQKLKAAGLSCFVASAGV